MTDINKRILELDEKATPGPWRWCVDKYYFSGHELTSREEQKRNKNAIIKSTRDDGIATVWNVSCTCIDGHQFRNQDLITEYRTLAPIAAKQNQIYREALEYYADFNRFPSSHQRAQTALKQAEEVK